MSLSWGQRALLSKLPPGLHRSSSEGEFQRALQNCEFCGAKCTHVTIHQDFCWKAVQYDIFVFTEILSVCWFFMWKTAHFVQWSLLFFVQGGVIGVFINWDCNLDIDPSNCKPTYVFRRLDVRKDQANSGYYYRQALTLNRDFFFNCIFEYFSLWLSIGSFVTDFCLQVCKILQQGWSRVSHAYQSLWHASGCHSSRTRKWLFHHFRVISLVWSLLYYQHSLSGWEIQPHPNNYQHSYGYDFSWNCK